MRKLFEKTKYIIIVILFLTIVFISFTNYKSIKQAIKEKYNNQNKLVENSILQEISHINDAYKIAEEQLNKEMKEYSGRLKDKYRKNPKIETWDLEKLKEDFGAYNIYIINNDLKVIKTTFEPDLGLDFSQYSGFSKLLKKRLEGDSFVVDRLNLSSQTGRIKKYSYMPTPDHKYLLQLSIDIKNRYPVLENLDVFADAKQIRDKYKSVEEISFYKFNPDTEEAAIIRDNKKPYINPDIADIDENFVKKTFNSQQIQVKKSPKQNYVSKYIPALVQEKATASDWWNSFILKIKYNNKIMFNEIKAKRNLFVINFLIMIAVFVTFIAIVIYLLRQFRQLAYYDQLTKLVKRESFAEKFADLAKLSNKQDKKIAILFLDIDKFKEINDNFGHDIGDMVLKKIALRLKNNLPQEYVISRLGGDEFTIAITDISSKKEVEIELNKVVNSFKEPLIIEGSQFFISVSIGVSIYPDHDSSLEGLIKKSDYAMYKAKKQQKNYVIYQK